MNKQATIMGFNPKTKNEVGKKLEKVKIQVEDDSSIATDEEEEDAQQFVQQSQSLLPPTPKKRKKSTAASAVEEIAILGNNFCLEGDYEESEKPTPENIAFATNFEVGFYAGETAYLKNTLEIKRSYVDSKGKERVFTFNVPKQSAWGLTAALMKLITLDGETMYIGRSDKNAMVRIRHFYNLLRSGCK